MPSDINALEERSTLFHDAKPNSSYNNKTARIGISPVLRKVLPGFDVSATREEDSSNLRFE